MGLADGVHFGFLDGGLGAIFLLKLIAIFLLLLRVVGVLATIGMRVWIFPQEGVVVDLQVDVDIPALLKIQGVVLAVFWRKAWLFGLGGGGIGYV